MIAQGMIIQNETYLMVKQLKHNRIFWNFPGGHIKDGESPEQACLREIFEETGYTARLLEKIGHHNYNHLYIAEIVSGTMKLEEGLLDISWVAETEVDKWDHKTLETLSLYKKHIQG